MMTCYRRKKHEDQQLQTAALLLSMHFNVNSSNSNGNTALHFAVFFQFSQVVAFLLEQGADVDQKNREGYTPFSLLPLSSSEVEQKEIKNILDIYRSHILRNLGMFKQGTIIVNEYVSREETSEERLQRGYMMKQLSLEEANDYDKGKYPRP